jgi:hypothetical protein
MERAAGSPTPAASSRSSRLTRASAADPCGSTRR